MIPLLIPVVAGLAALILEGCGDDEPEPQRPPPPERCDRDQNPTCTLTLQPANIPDVYINEEPVPAQSSNPDSWIVYRGICTDPRQVRYPHVLPSGEETVTAGSGISILKPLTNGDGPFAFCSVLDSSRSLLEGGHLLDPIGSRSFNFDEPVVESWLDERFGGPPITSSPAPYLIQIDESILWLPLYYRNTTMAVASWNLARGEGSIVWQAEVPGSSDHGVDLYSLTQSGKLLIGLGRDSYTNAAVFDLHDLDFEGLVTMPHEPIFYEGDTTIEGVLFSELQSYISQQYVERAPLYYGGQLLFFSRPYLLDTEELRDRGLRSQSGPATLTRFDIEIGDRISDVRLPVFELTEAVRIEGTGQIAIAGNADPFLGELDGEERIFATPTLLVMDADTGEILTQQDLSDARPVPDSPFFTGLGDFSTNGRVFYHTAQAAFEYQDGRYVPFDLPPIQEVRIGPLEYTYAEAPEMGVREVEISASFGLNREQTMGVFCGINRDCLLVDVAENQAYYFRLPIEASCYNFWSGLDPATGEHTYQDSCDLELGGVVVFNRNIYVGYDTAVWRLPLPY